MQLLSFPVRYGSCSALALRPSPERRPVVLCIRGEAVLAPPDRRYDATVEQLLLVRVLDVCCYKEKSRRMR